MYDDVTLPTRRPRWRRLITVVAAVALSLGAALAVAHPAKADNYLGFREYVNGASNLCLDDQYSQQYDGAEVQQWGCNGTDAQAWNYDFTTGALALPGLAGQPNYCLDGGANQPGTRVQLWSCNGTADQAWEYVNSQLVSEQSGLCLDNPSGQSNWGNRMQLWYCNGNSAQQWYVYAQ